VLKPPPYLLYTLEGFSNLSASPGKQLDESIALARFRNLLARLNTVRQPRRVGYPNFLLSRVIILCKAPSFGIVFHPYELEII